MKKIVDAINILTKSTTKYEEGDAEVSMCKGLEEFKKDAELKGKEEKEIEMLKTMHNNGANETTIAKLLGLDINYVKLVLSK